MAQIATLNARFGGSKNSPTRLIAYDATAPLKIARPFGREDGSIDVCLMDASPGLLEGDDYRLSWYLERDARVSVTTQGFTRVHPSIAVYAMGSPASSIMTTSLQLEAGAFLSYLPEPALLYERARFGASLKATVSKGATLFISDSFAAGRIARKERFEFGLFHNSILLCDEEGPLFCNRTRIVPAQMNPTQFAVCGNWTHMATLVAINDTVNEEWLAVSRETVNETIEILKGGQKSIKSCVSLLSRRTIVVNIFAHRAHEIGQIIQKLTKEWEILVDRAAALSKLPETLYRHE